MKKLKMRAHKCSPSSNFCLKNLDPPQIISPKTYSKTKTHAITQLMRKVLKRLDNLRENRESMKQSSIRWVFLIIGN